MLNKKFLLEEFIPHTLGIVLFLLTVLAAGVITRLIARTFMLGWRLF